MPILIMIITLDDFLKGQLPISINDVKIFVSCELRKEQNSSKMNYRKMETTYSEVHRPRGWIY